VKRASIDGIELEYEITPLPPGSDLDPNRVYAP
jgi:hypothetical protein